MKLLYSTAWLLCVWVSVLPAQEAVDPVVAVDASHFHEHVAWLADDARAGRGTGSEGLEATAEYITERFQAFGLEPGGADGGYLQPFEAAGSRALGEGNSLTVGGTELALEQDWIPFASTVTSTAEGTLVFAGYGIQDIEGDYDDYAGLDVSGKVVLVLRRGPGASLEGDDEGERNEDEGSGHEEPTVSRYLDPAGKARRLIDFTSKINTAFKAGAAAVIVVNDPATYPPGSEEDVPLSYGSTRSGGVSASLPAVHMSAGAAMSVLEPLGVDLAELQTRIDERMAPSSFDPGVHGGDLEAWKVRVEVVAERESVATYNVVGILRGARDVGGVDDPSHDPDAEPHLLVGAHMDHLGDGQTSSGSLAGDAGRGKIHNGADDNASGTAGLIELARVLGAREDPLPHSVVFVAFGAEEWGLLGSRHYVEHPVLPLSELYAMVNMDMIGRSADGFLSVEGLGTSPVLEEIVTTSHERIGSPFDRLALSDNVPPNSDQAPFAENGIPILAFFTGLHDDYHRPSDDVEDVDSEAGARIASLAGECLVALASLDEKPEFTAPEASPHGGTAKPEEGREVKGYSIWFGSVPDMTYTKDDGVRISDTRESSPARKAGLVKGDVIVSFEGQTVRNLEDYAVLLFSRRPGETITVGVLRDGELIELEATLETKGGDS